MSVCEREREWVCVYMWLVVCFFFLVSVVRCIKMYLNLLSVEEYFCHSAAAMTLGKF